MAVFSLNLIKSAPEERQNLYLQYGERQTPKSVLPSQTNRSEVTKHQKEFTNASISDRTAIQKTIKNITNTPKKISSKIKIKDGTILSAKNIPRKIVTKRKKKRIRTHPLNKTRNIKAEMLASKSDQVLLQYYPTSAVVNPEINLNANPINLNANPANLNGNSNIFDINYDILSASLSPQPTFGYITPNYHDNQLSTISYKTIPEQTQFLGDLNQNQLFSPVQIPFNNKPLNWNLQVTTDRSLPLYERRPGPIPSLDVKRPHNFRNRANKLNPLVQVRPPFSISSTTSPMKTVTHVFKYDESTGNLRLPFLEHSDESIDVPALSAALEEHNNARSNIIIPNYLTPPKLNQPVFYGMHPIEVVTLPPLRLPNGFGNEFEVINKFNNVLRVPQKLKKHKPSVDTSEYDDDEANLQIEDQGEKTFTDEEVDQAIKYMQNIKKNRNKLSNKIKQNNRKRNNKKRKGKKKGSFEEEIEQEVDLNYEKARNPKNELYEDTEDDNYYANQEEEDDNVNDDTNRKLSQVDSKEEVSNQKIQVLDDNEQQDEGYVSAPDIYPNTESETEAANVDNANHNEHADTESNDGKGPDFSQNVEIGSENDGDRVEFQMHGLRGPESYKFGYDTGKGDNRQFRYEERDAEGKVKGHYGYYDAHGRLQLYNYAADENGYQLEQGH